jgi:hypothetical protein
MLSLFKLFIINLLSIYNIDKGYVDSMIINRIEEWNGRQIEIVKELLGVKTRFRLKYCPQ